jgi:hypothetical protein
MLWLLLCCLCYYPAQAQESYSERLSLVPLNGGRLLTRFEFRVGAAEGAHDLFQWGDNADCTDSTVSWLKLIALARQTLLPT